MRHGKRPAYQWYPGDAKRDEAFLLMSYEQRGIYRELLDHQWDEGSIPGDADQIHALLPKISRDRFLKLWPLISSKFEPLKDGRLANAKLYAQKRELDKYVKIQQVKGAKGAARRWKKNGKATVAVAIAPAMPVPSPDDSSSSSTSTSSSPSEMQIQERPSDELFECFFQAYPPGRQTDTVLVRQAFLAACEVIGFPELMLRLAEHKRCQQWQDGVIPSMKTFFGEKRWRSPLPPSADKKSQGRHGQWVGKNPNAEIRDV